MLERLHLFIESQCTDPNLNQAIIAGLRPWGEKQPQPASSLPGPTSAQDNLGWQATPEGTISTEWMAKQTSDLQTIQHTGHLFAGQ